jgi:5-formyltetrahydrofolate cyclo-ligase
MAYFGLAAVFSKRVGRCIRSNKSATAIKINPDSPQRPLRAEALRHGITVFVPTPRLRGGFKM